LPRPLESSGHGFRRRADEGSCGVPDRQHPRQVRGVNLNHPLNCHNYGAGQLRGPGNTVAVLRGM
jgi:hypothetical protein